MALIDTDYVDRIDYWLDDIYNEDDTINNIWS